MRPDAVHRLSDLRFPQSCTAANSLRPHCRRDCGLSDADRPAVPGTSRAARDPPMSCTAMQYSPAAPHIQQSSPPRRKSGVGAGKRKRNRSDRFDLPGERRHRNRRPFCPGLIAAQGGKPFAGANSIKVMTRPPLSSCRSSTLDPVAPQIDREKIHSSEGWDGCVQARGSLGQQGW